jgi:hypothetical protein
MDNSKEKTDMETAAATRQPKENKVGSIEPEAKKPRVQAEDLDKSAASKLGTPAI